jgi:hypothetical protein
VRDWRQMSLSWITGSHNSRILHLLGQSRRLGYWSFRQDDGVRTFVRNKSLFVFAGIGLLDQTLTVEVLVLNNALPAQATQGQGFGH